MLIQLLDSLPVTIQLNSKVIDVDPSTPLVTLASGESIRGDLVVGADGLRSTVRTVVAGREDKPEPTGDAAYRAMIPAEVVLADPDLRDLIENPALDIWMGPGRHIVGYWIVGGMSVSME
jgi:salicylate hydroxylase